MEKENINNNVKMIEDYIDLIVCMTETDSSTSNDVILIICDIVEHEKFLTKNIMEEISTCFYSIEASQRVLCSKLINKEKTCLDTGDHEKAAWTNELLVKINSKYEVIYSKLISLEKYTDSIESKIYFLKLRYLTYFYGVKRGLEEVEKDLTSFKAAETKAIQEEELNSYLEIIILKSKFYKSVLQDEVNSDLFLEETRKNFEQQIKSKVQQYNNILKEKSLNENNIVENADLDFCPEYLRRSNALINEIIIILSNKDRKYLSLREKILTNYHTDE